MEELEIKLKEAGKISRLTNKTFQFSPLLGEGFYTANYFLKTRKIVEEHLPGHTVVMQFFQRHDNVMVCGLDEAISLVKTFARNPQDLKIYALDDGDMINQNEPVLKIEGRYEDFGFLESTIDGILARRTSVATNTATVLKAAGSKTVFSMADRQDDYLTQVGDGYASYIAGIRHISTDAQGKWWGGKGMGTMPHALIQICGGDLLKAADLFQKTFPGKVTALVDYNNNVVEDSVKLAKHLQGNLKAVRVDTSIALIDKFFENKDTHGFNPHGVNPQLIKGLREALDKAGYPEVKIIVSSGFNTEKIRYFEENKTPVDMYGVGENLIRLTINFVGDLVVLDGKAESKVGRYNIDNPRLKLVD